MQGDGERGANSHFGRGSPHLSTEASNWQTPGAMDGGSVRRGGDRGQELLLTGQASSFTLAGSGCSPPDPAPSTSGDESSRSSPTSRQRLIVDWIARSLNTTSRDFCEELRRVSTGERAVELDETSLCALFDLFPPKRFLNPRFVEWLMGFPPDFTALSLSGSTVSGDWATRWSRYRALLRSECSRLTRGSNCEEGTRP
jgi:hypothetical protein